MRPEEALSTAGVLNGDTLHLAVTQPNTQQSESPSPQLMWQRGMRIEDAAARASSNAATLERENASMLLMMGTSLQLPCAVDHNHFTPPQALSAVFCPHRCLCGVLPWAARGAVFDRNPHITTYETRYRPRPVCQHDADADGFHTRRYFQRRRA